MTKSSVSSPGDGRNNADRVARGHRRLLSLQVPDIFVVQIDVDEAAQLALLVVQMRLETGMFFCEVGQQLADRGTGRLDGVLLIGVRTKRCRNQNSRCRHSAFPHQNWTGLLSETTPSCRARRRP